MAISYVSYSNRSPDSPNPAIDQSDWAKADVLTNSKKSLEILKEEVGVAYGGEFVADASVDGGWYFVDTAIPGTYRHLDWKYTETDFTTGEWPWLPLASVDFWNSGEKSKSVNVYDYDSEMKKVLMDVLWDDQKTIWWEDVHKRTFGINIGMEWLSGVVKSILAKNSWNFVNIDNLSKDDFEKQYGFEYKRMWGLDNERNKIQKIIRMAIADTNFADRLKSAVNLVERSGFASYRSIKQMYNFKQNIENNVFSKDTILFALCDYDGSGSVATRSSWGVNDKTNHSLSRKEFKEQYTGTWNREDARKVYKVENKDAKRLNSDVWTIFGIQLQDKIKDAIVTLDTRLQIQKNRNYYELEYWEWCSGLNIVINNILTTVMGFCENNSKLSQKIAEQIKPENIISCTNQTLYNIVKEFPEFQPIFANAIESLNGSPFEVSTNLVDNLMWDYRIDFSETTGNEMFDRKRKVKSDLLEYYKKYNVDQAVEWIIKEKFKDDYFVLKTRMPMAFYSFLGNLEFNYNDWKWVYEWFDSWYLSKDRQVNEKEEFWKTITDQFASSLKAGINVQGTEDWKKHALWFNIRNEWSLADWKWKYRVKSSLSFHHNGGTTAVDTNFFINVGIARQLNYKKMVSFGYDEFMKKTSHYVWVEFQANSNFETWDVRLGVYHEMDRAMAIEQRHKQLANVMVGAVDVNNEYIFDLSGFTDFGDYDKLLNHLNSRVDSMYAGYKPGSRVWTDEEAMQAFVYNNRVYLKAYIKNYVDTLGNRWVIKAMQDDNAVKAYLTTKWITNPTDADIQLRKQYAMENMFREFSLSTVSMSSNIAMTWENEKLRIEEYWVGLLVGEMGPGFYAWAVPKVYLSHYSGSPDSEAYSTAMVRGSGEISTRQLETGEDLQSVAKQIQWHFSVPLWMENGKTLYSQSGIDPLTWETREPLIKVDPYNGGLLKVTLNPKYTQKTLDHVLNVRVLNDVGVLKNVQRLADGSLIIWDVGPIDVRTYTDGDEVKNVLILWKIWTRWSTDTGDEVGTLRIRPWHNTKLTPAGIDVSWQVLDFGLNDLKQIIVNSNIPTGHQASVEAVLEQAYSTGVLTSVAGIVIVGPEWATIKWGTLEIVDWTPTTIKYTDDGTDNLTITYEVNEGSGSWTDEKIKQMLAVSSFKDNENEHVVVESFLVDKWLLSTSGLTPGQSSVNLPDWTSKTLKRLTLPAFPKVWKIIFTEKSATEIEVSYDSTVTDKLYISYIKFGSTGNEQKIENIDRKEYYGDVKTLSEDAMLWGYYTGLWKLLREEENSEWAVYKDFLKFSSRVIDGDNEIGDVEFQKAWESLWNIIDEKSTDPNVQKLKELYENWDEVTKVYVITRMKAILAMEIYDDQVIKTLLTKYRMTGSEPSFLSKGWPSETGFDSNLSNHLKDLWFGFRDGSDGTKKYKDFKHGEQREADRIKRDSAIIGGFTAFYRPVNRGFKTFSSTPSFDTRVLWDFYNDSRNEQWQLVWSQEQENQARDWLIGNLKITKYQRMLIADVISRKISTAINENITVDESKIIELLEWKEIDISWKKVKLDTSVVFYLLDECGNESLWFNLRSISITKQWWDGSSIDADWYITTTIYTWTGIRPREMWVQLFAGNSVVTQVAGVSKVDWRIGYASYNKDVEKLTQDPNPEDRTTTTEAPTQNPNPNLPQPGQSPQGNG